MKPSARASVLCGLIGSGIQASRTPALHEREGDEQGLRYVYKCIDLDELKLGTAALPDLIVAAERTGFAGLNITYPCKQSILPLLHELSDDARALNAVNTVVLRNGQRVGHNTDWSGFAESFRLGLPGAKLNRVVQIGAGGAGAASAYAALTLGVAHLSVFDREPGRAAGLAASLSRRFGPGRAALGTDLADAMARADGLIHATPTGMAKCPGLPLPADLLRSTHWIAEVVYLPLETELLRVARGKGCRTLDGGGMAVFQAAGAFRHFTGIEPDVERMLRHFAAMGRA
jgi:shikimate dehydrogenase